MSMTFQVRAAGGVVWRDEGEGPAVLVVHRPRYDDWSLPKGKLDEGESFETAALREILEETGVVGTLGLDLGPVFYIDHKGRSKVVRWWTVQATPATARRTTPPDGDEVDVMRWVAPDEAVALVSYDTDREVLARYAAARQAVARATVGG